MRVFPLPISPPMVTGRISRFNLVEAAQVHADKSQHLLLKFIGYSITLAKYFSFY